MSGMYLSAAIFLVGSVAFAQESSGFSVTTGSTAPSLQEKAVEQTGAQPKTTSKQSDDKPVSTATAPVTEPHESPITVTETLNGSDRYRHDENNYIVRDQGGAKVKIPLAGSSLFGMKLRPYQDGLDYVDHLDGFQWKKISESSYEELPMDDRYDILYGRMLYFGANKAAKDLDARPKDITAHMPGDPELELAVARLKPTEVQRKRTALIVGAATLVLSYVLLVASVADASTTNCDTENDFTYCDNSSASVDGGLLAASGITLLAGGAFTLWSFVVPGSDEVKMEQTISRRLIANP